MRIWLITRRNCEYAVVEADTEEEALLQCEMGLVHGWTEDDRPYEYSNDLGEPYYEDD